MNAGGVFLSKGLENGGADVEGNVGIAMQL